MKDKETVSDKAKKSIAKMTERESELQLYHEIFKLICKHGHSRDRILKACRFKYSADGTLCKGQTFEWHWKKVSKSKPLSKKSKTIVI